MSDACPTPIGGASAQVDLNAPVTPAVPTYTQIHLGELADLCRAGVDSSIVTGVLMQFLANHFSSAGLIMQPALKQYVYVPGNTTGLRIANYTQFDPTSGQLPALIVKRGRQASRRLSLTDANQMSQWQAQEGYGTGVRMVDGTSTIYCCSSADGEAESLGDEVFDSLTYMSRVFMEQLPFHNFEITVKDELGVLEDLGNLLAVPITVQYSYEYGWASQPLAPKLKTLGLAIE